MINTSRCVAALFLFFSIGGAHAEVPASTTMMAALPAALEAIYEKPEGPGGTSFAPVIVLAEGVPVFSIIKAFDVPAVVKSRAQAREEQLAWFLYLSAAEETVDTLKVSYMKPYNGMFGSVSLNKADGKWNVVEHKKMHSSSGARHFYGELYADSKCRSGSDMAKRWNYSVGALDAIAAGRPRLALSDTPSTCLGDTFPDVAAYQRAKKLGLIR